MKFNLLHLLAAFCFGLYFMPSLCAQDLIFLRDEGETLECIILQTNDSSIVFRLMDPQDDQEYEVLSALTYGFLLESEALSKSLKSECFQFEFSHPAKKRRPVFREGNSVLFRFWGDTVTMPRRAKIIELGCDSIMFEIRKKRIPQRFVYPISAIQEFGYTTPLTEIFTLIIAPVSALKDGSFFIYRKLNFHSGWSFKCSRAPDEISRLILKRYPTKIRKQHLPKVIHKNNRRSSADGPIK